MKAQLLLCRIREGIVERRPVRYGPDETLDDVVARILQKKEPYYGDSCYVPIGESQPTTYEEKWKELYRWLKEHNEVKGSGYWFVMRRMRELDSKLESED